MCLLLLYHSSFLNCSFFLMINEGHVALFNHLVTFNVAKRSQNVFVHLISSVIEALASVFSSLKLTKQKKSYLVV